MNKLLQIQMLELESGKVFIYKKILKFHTFFSKKWKKTLIETEHKIADCIKDILYGAGKIFNILRW